MKNQIFIKYIYPILINLIFSIILVFISNRIEQNSFMISLMLYLFIINTIFYFFLFFTIGLIFKNPINRTLISFCLSYVILGKFFKIMHWPGGTLLFLLGTLITVGMIMFLIIKVYQNYRTKSSQNE